MIVVVDDDPGILKSVGRLLKVHGFNVSLFTSAEAHQAEASSIDAACLILDIQLPGTSGIDLLRGLLRSGCEVPVIFMTASDSEVTRRSATDLGCVAYIQKPFTSMTLIEAVKKAIGTKS